MRVLLLGATGNLGHHVVPALLKHHHTVTVFIRSLPKLQSLLPASIVSQLTIVIGEALDSAAIESAILTHNCDALISTAGNQAAPWKEQLMPKIALAIVTAAVAAGKVRGSPMRAWLIGGMNSLPYPGTKYLIEDYIPYAITDHHRQTLKAIETASVADLRWSVVCVAMMTPFAPTISEDVTAARDHELLVTAEAVPDWEDNCLRSIPLIGVFLNLYYGVSKHTTYYEDVADFMAGDLESGGETFVGKKVGIKQRRKAK